MAQGRRIVRGEAPKPDVEAEVVVIGAGAAGLTAALRAADAGADVLVLERDASPSGSTSLSSGFVPAPGTRFQRAIGVDDDDAALFCADIVAKSHGLSDPELARLAANHVGDAVEWLADHAGLDWIVLDDFLYPGHSRHRMHAVPEKTGAALEARLLTAAGAAVIPIATGALADTLYLGAGDAISAVAVTRADGGAEVIGCQALILACNGYGGDPALVRRHIPEIADGLYFGHAGNTGDAILWGDELGADVAHLSGYQGHGSVAHPHGVLITWALMMEGGVQVNALGERFSNEHLGYSEQATHVLAQPGGVAWCVFDRRLHEFAMAGFPDYRDAEAAGAVLTAPGIAGLAALIGCPEQALAATLAACAAEPTGVEDPFGRDFSKGRPLAPPFCAIRVTGALFHTQGGLRIGDDGRVLSRGGAPFPNLYAAGGAACGVSGPRVEGYLSGNGLLTALAFGHVAGGAAAGRLRR